MIKRQYFIPEPEAFLAEVPLTKSLQGIKEKRDKEICDVIAGKSGGVYLPGGAYLALLQLCAGLSRQVVFLPLPHGLAGRGGGHGLSSAQGVQKASPQHNRLFERAVLSRPLAARKAGAQKAARSGL